MADVTRPRPLSGCGERDDRDRGQLFLVAALSLAVLFVSLALLLNTAIFTENLATRNTDPGTDPSISYRSAAIDAAEELILREQANATPAQDAGVARDRYATTIDEWSDGTGLHGARRARFVDMSVSSTTDGTRFEQTNLSRSFTNRSGSASDWELAPSTHVSEVEFTVNKSTLASSSSGAFRLYLENSSDATNSSSVTVYEDGGSVTVEVENATDSASCTVPVGSHAVVDITGGSINDTACPVFGQTLTLDDPVNVQFDNGDRAAGTYSIIVEGQKSSLSDDDTRDSTTSDSPFLTAVVYEASVTVTYESTDVNYQTTITVDAPEEL